MRWALNERNERNKRVEAAPGLKGLCPGCAQPLIAKCGTQRIHHWAHRSNKECDRWWEPETEWHRSWKDNFPADWQEIFLPDELTGEKHIADIRTVHGLVIEFQHSHIDPEERAVREKFYQNMVWVVDGTRLKRDYPRFLKCKESFMNATRLSPALDGFFLVRYPNKCFPSAWLESSVPVIFDFLEMTAPTQPQVTTQDALWCLLPGRAREYAVLNYKTRTDFIEIILKNTQLFPCPSHKIISFIEDYFRNIVSKHSF